jgi:hypothetical protein
MQPGDFLPARVRASMPVDKDDPEQLSADMRSWVFSSQRRNT